MKSLIYPPAAALIISLAAGCSDSETPTQENERKLPEMMKFSGNANGVDDDVTINCLCDLNLELTDYTIEPDGTQEYTGTLGGEITRAVENPEGDGFAFAPFLFGEITLTLLPNDSVYLAWPGNLNTGIAFYDNISLFRGKYDPASETVTGTWDCAPLDIDEGGYTDVKGTATGTWTLEIFE